MAHMEGDMEEANSLKVPSYRRSGMMKNTKKSGSHSVWDTQQMFFSSVHGESTSGRSENKHRDPEAEVQLCV